MRKDDLLPNGLRLMTREGLRFVASYRGMVALSLKQAQLGGRTAENWRQAALKAQRVLESDGTDPSSALDAFQEAARQEGWSVRGTERWPSADPVRSQPRRPQAAAL
jgi:hypothetical protein